MTPRNWFFFPSEEEAAAVQQECVSLGLSTNKFFQNASNNHIGIDNEWTYSMWVKPFNLNGYFFGLKNTSHNKSLVYVSIAGSQANDPLEIYMFNAAGTVLKRYRWNSVFTIDDWVHIIFTWNGTDLKAYIDSVDTVPDSKLNNNVGSTGADLRKVGYGTVWGGTNFRGRLGHLSIWNEALEPAEVTEIFNGNFDIDLRSDTGNYTSSDNLMHYWRVGENAEDLLSDEVEGFYSIDFDDDAFNPIASDIYVDSPPNTFKNIKSIYFAGTNGYIEGPTLDTIGPFTNRFSFQCWTKWKDGDTPSSKDCLLGATTDWNTFYGGFGLYWEDASNISFFMTQANKVEATGPMDPTAGWHHVVGTYDGTLESDNINLYVDGSRVAFYNFDSNMSEGDSKFEAGRCGNLNVPAANYAQAHMDEVALWDDALTAAEVTELYNSGSVPGTAITSDFGEYASSANLKLWWRMGDDDEYLSTTMTDQSGNSRDGTNKNLLWTSRTEDVPS